MVLLANFTAIAIVLGLIESYISIIQVPGAKLGLANLVTIIILYLFSYKEAILVTLTRVFIIALATTFGPTFWMGFVGAIFSVTFMAIFKKVGFGIILVSLIGSITHQIGQIVVGIKILGSNEIILYLVIMIPIGIVMGILIGVISGNFLKHYEKNKIE